MKRLLIVLFISIFIIGAFYTSFSYADDNATRDKIDSQVARFTKLIGYLVILIVGIKDILSEIQKGNPQGVWSVVLKYIFIYAALLTLPVGMKWVEEFVEGLK